LEGGDFNCPEITGLDYDLSSGFLIVAHRYQNFHLFQILINHEFTPKLIREWILDGHTPSAVCFGQLSAGGPDIWSFGRDDGIMCVLP
jgi:hypothetical protein